MSISIKYSKAGVEGETTFVGGMKISQDTRGLKVTASELSCQELFGRMHDSTVLSLALDRDSTQQDKSRLMKQTGEDESESIQSWVFEEPLAFQAIHYLTTQTVLTVVKSTQKKKKSNPRWVWG